MGHVIGIGKMERPGLPELPRSVPTIRRGTSGDCEFTNSYSAKGTSVDEGKLEVSSNRYICVTVLNVDQLNKAARCVVESKAGCRLRRWGAIALVTWAVSSTVIATMQYRTIQELELIARQQVQTVEQVEQAVRSVDAVRQSIQAAKEHRDAIDKAVIKHLGEQKWREMQQK